MFTVALYSQVYMGRESNDPISDIRIKLLESFIRWRSLTNHTLTLNLAIYREYVLLLAGKC